MKAISIAIVLFLLSCNIARSEVISIQGQIRDAEGPISGVSWIILDGDKNAILTKPDGRFSFHTGNGLHRFEIHHTGYFTSIFELSLNQDTALIVLLKKPILTRDLSKQIHPQLYFNKWLNTSDSLGSIQKNESKYLMYGSISNALGQLKYEEMKEVESFIRKDDDMNSLLKNISISSIPPLDFRQKLIKIRNEFNPRGFISPLSESFPSDYLFFNEGSYLINGSEIQRIRVVRKQNWKPLFNGYIDWDIINQRPYEINLNLNRLSLMENARMIEIRQRFKFVSDSSTLIDFQEVTIKFNEFGANSKAFFALKLDGENINQQMTRVLHRPNPNIRFKESKPQIISNMILRGFSVGDNMNHDIFFVQPLMKTLTYNAVERISILTGFSWRRKLDQGRFAILEPTLRYGTGNGHLNVDVQGKLFYNPKNSDVLTWGGGKRIQQFNTDNPVPQLMNSFSIINQGINHLKIFENTFFHLGWRKNLFRHTTVSGSMDFQHRSPLVNFNAKYAPNYPSEITTQPMPIHQSLQFKLGITVFTSKIPNRNEESSDYRKYGQPKINFIYTKGIQGLMGSDVNFDKWRASFSGQVDFRMKGTFLYHVQAGGFLTYKRVELPDYHHFWGNQTRKAFPYLESFQLVPFYAFSNTNRTFYALHFEHRFKGFITEKIPIIRNANVYLVCGGNSFNSGKMKYAELFWGLDNFMKFIRIDHIISIQGAFQQQGIRIGISGYDKLFAEN